MCFSGIYLNLYKKQIYEQQIKLMGAKLTIFWMQKKKKKGQCYWPNTLPFLEKLQIQDSSYSVLLPGHPFLIPDLKWWNGSWATGSESKIQS